MIDNLEALPVSSAVRERRTMALLIAESLRGAILAGVFTDGTELNQVELAEHFGTSRVPVREALHQLLAEGLVKAEPHKRMVVAGLDGDRLAESFDTRIVLECHLIEKALPRLEPKVVARLRKICDEMDNAKEHMIWLDRSRLFYETLYEPSQALLTIDFVKQLADRTQRYVRMANIGVQREQRGGAEHRRMVDLAEAGDLVGLKAMVVMHIGNTRNLVLKAMERRRAATAAPDVQPTK